MTQHEFWGGEILRFFKGDDTTGNYNKFDWKVALSTQKNLKSASFPRTHIFFTKKTIDYSISNNPTSHAPESNIPNNKQIGKEWQEE